MEFLSAKFNVINFFPCEKGFYTQPRLFNYPYLLYVHSGKGEYKIGKKRYVCQKGDLFFCPSGVENTIFASDIDPFVLSGIEFTVNDNSVLNLNMPDQINILNNDFAENCILKMVEEYLYERIYSINICTSLLNAFLIEVCRLKSQQTMLVKNDANNILHYISTNVNRKITVEEISEFFHYHKNTINRIVKKTTGCSVKEYILNLRIKNAKRYLLFTNKNIEEIAYLLNYSSSAFFCLQFKEKTGVSPSTFRKHPTVF